VPVRHLLTVNKQSTIRKLREELFGIAGDESSDIVIAEVLGNHIARILVSIKEMFGHRSSLNEVFFYK